VNIHAAPEEPKLAAFLVSRVQLFCILAEQKLLSWVALWALGFVHASVRARTGGCGSGSSLTITISLLGDILTHLINHDELVCLCWNK
jgi:hypothetical protein